MKRMISLVLTLCMLLTAASVCAVSVAAEDTRATVTVGDRTYAASVGDYLQYNLSLSYTGKKLATAQAELPFDFDGMSCYTQKALEQNLSAIAPYTAASTVLLRSEGDSALGLDGYVANFASVSGFDFSTERAMIKLIFCIEKPGAYTFSAKVRYVEDIDGATVVDGAYNKVDDRFSYTENIYQAAIGTPSLTAATAVGGIRISWDAVPGAVNYRVYYKGKDGWTAIDDTDETSYLDTYIPDGSTFTYTVRCISADGTREVGDYDTVGKTATYYAAPQIKLSLGTDGISLKWNSTKNAAKYRVYYKGTSGWTKLTDTAENGCIDTNVVSGKTYTYTIRSMDANNKHMSWYYSGFSIRYVAAPTFSLSKAANGVSISWDAVQGAEKYRVFYHNGKAWKRLADTAATSYLDKNVSSDKVYKYTVRCISADGESYASSYRAGKTIKYYAAPRLQLKSTANGVSLTWDKIKGASQYRLYYKVSGTWTKIIDTAGTSYVHTAVTPGKRYTYTIRAMDANGNHLSWYYTEGFSITYSPS